MSRSILQPEGFKARAPWRWRVRFMAGLIGKMITWIAGALDAFLIAMAAKVI